MTPLKPPKISSSSFVSCVYLNISDEISKIGRHQGFRDGCGILEVAAKQRKKGLSCYNLEGLFTKRV
jgi:hypothetical protein